MGALPGNKLQAVAHFHCVSPAREENAQQLGFGRRDEIMEAMRYEAPDSVSGAVALLAAARGDARVLAGGTDLLVQLRAGRVEPELVVDPL